MPDQEITSQRTRVSVAVASALKLRGLSHEDAAGLLGKSVQTVHNRISMGDFTPKLAKEWSETLGIPIECFSGEIDESEDIRVRLVMAMQEIRDINAELSLLKGELYELRSHIQSK